jgi:hypothetical protein
MPTKLQRAQACVKVAAVRCLGRLLVLSQALCTAHLPVLESCLAGGWSAMVKAAAVAVIADVVDAFPSAFGSKLGLVGQMVVQPGGTGTLHMSTDCARGQIFDAYCDFHLCPGSTAGCAGFLLCLQAQCVVGMCGHDHGAWPG